MQLTLFSRFQSGSLTWTGSVDLPASSWSVCHWTLAVMQVVMRRRNVPTSLIRGISMIFDQQPCQQLAACACRLQAPKAPHGQSLPYAQTTSNFPGRAEGYGSNLCRASLCSGTFANDEASDETAERIRIVLPSQYIDQAFCHSRNRLSVCGQSIVGVGSHWGVVKPGDSDVIRHS